MSSAQQTPKVSRDTLLSVDWIVRLSMFDKSGWSLYYTYNKAVRNGGMNYYMLATTGGDSRLRGPEYGEVDHLVWVTMKKDGPVVANILLDGILREDLTTFASDEEGGKHGVDIGRQRAEERSHRSGLTALA